MSDTKLNFGKHKGKTIGNLLVTERKYLEWLAAQDFFKEYIIYQKVIDALGGPNPSPAGVSTSAPPLAGAGSVMPGNEAGTVNFGKYKGLPVATLFADLDYCKWILNQDWFKRNALYLEVLKLVGEPEVKSSSIYESGSSGISTPGIDTVAFGKYKGQPMATLFADKQYCKWVVGQEWFSRNPVFGRVKAVADTVPAPSAMRGQSPPPDSPPPDSPCSGGGDSDHGEYEPDDD